MIELFKNKLIGNQLINKRLDKDRKHHNKFPLNDAKSIGLIFYIKDSEQLRSTLNESKIVDKIFPKGVKNIEFIFITEEKKIEFDVPFGYKIIPLSKVNWNKKNPESNIENFIKKEFDYLFSFTYGVSKILDQLVSQSYAICRVALGEHQDVDSHEMKLTYDQVSFTERIREAVDILHRMHK
ncbi:hypothetical protein KMW28_10570 [Flammeovirga yaeyamensis]|uniref:Uncharacterized protein n=1 Tax=Flammeovirga yaeyamensis TaxID=367791 RepID=A0AAX1MXQ4_9BACT|nr:hypothetical protein [Flammeovirga yaeyamensis]MBB3696401.1 hypothetical protein [Flammeovirga yaeyamensis]NMF35080.1 hypothetical protein [Flammeovirga yaeyamensis]QWG00099.1 hypothetical protein KMW28_10570 [Flammeovirga yaeyamensis]